MIAIINDNYNNTYLYLIIRIVNNYINNIGFLKIIFEF